MACCIYLNGKGQMMAKVVANWLSHDFFMIGCELFTHPTVITALITSEGDLLLVAVIPQVPQWQNHPF
jgi:hypothetical protein